MFLEVIAKDLEDIKIINKSQADQIEFCIDMEKDGLTPPVSLITKATKIARPRLMIMLRKKYSNFVLDDNDVKDLIKIIKATKHLKFKGYVFGATKNDQIDLETLQQISETVGDGKEITFHKAFDTLKDQKTEIQKLVKFKNVKSVLTSGGTDNNPLKHLKHLKELANQKLEIMVGGGVSLENAKKLISNNLKKLHVGKAIREANSYQSPISIAKINYMKQLEKLDHVSLESRQEDQ